MAEAAEQADPGLLEGLKVVDLTTFLSGPFCTQILADLGATVIKVEAPEGDSSRSIPPYFVGDDSAYYLTFNRGKQSVAIDLKQEGGVQLVRSLIARADVVVENFRPGVATRLGLSPQELLSEHESLIWASITGFGQDGPLRNRPAYDMIVQAMAGVMSLTGEPGRSPVRVGTPVGDITAGMYAAIGILAALNSKDPERKRHVDVAMLDGQLAMLSYQAAYALIGGAVPGPQGSRHDSIPTYRSFHCGDNREVVITANTERMWTELCSELNLADLVNDPQYADAKSRLENRLKLWAVLEPAVAQRSAQELVDALNSRGVPAALIASVPEALSNAEENGRHMVVEFQRPGEPPLRVVGNPIHFTGSGARGNARNVAYPPRLGEDTERVLETELGLSTDAVADLEARGVVRGCNRG